MTPFKGLVLSLLMVLAGCDTLDTQSPDSKNDPIEPADVPAYIAHYQTLRQALTFEFEGRSYPIHLEDIVMDEGLLVIGYDLGYIIVSIDPKREEPTDDLFALQTRLPSDPPSAEQREFIGADVSMAEQGDAVVYRARLNDAQTGGVYQVRLVINEALFSTGSSTLELEDDHTAALSGTLGANTYVQIRDLIRNHPTVRTLVLDQIDGSIDDAINMHTGRLVRDSRLTTRVRSTSHVYSGGVDLYTAGYRREWEAGASLGVHSWCCVNGQPANELDRNDPAHRGQLAYFREMLGSKIGPAFYYFTLQAAPFDGIHVMSMEELARYQLIKP